MEEWFMIKELWREGMSISAIANETGRDRKTIRKCILAKEPPTYGPRTPKPGLLDPYRDYVRRRVMEHDITAIRILREIRGMGYKGQYTILKDFIQPLRKERGIQAVYRFETKPGVQSQVDFDQIGWFEENGELNRLYCFSMVLGYSRMRYIEFTPDKTEETLIQCHINAFAYFGGYTQEILYDNMKTVVITRTLKYEDIEWNQMFLDFSRYYGFVPRLCKPSRAQTKGKIERVVGFVQQDFLNGLEYTSLADLNGKTKAWLESVNGRVHRTTGVVPRERYQEEHLSPVAGKTPYQFVRIEYRKVSRDCFVSYLGNRYSVPWRHAGMHARILVRDRKLKVEIAGETVCEHEVRAGSNAVIRVKEHFEGLLRELRGTGRCLYMTSF
jgi:transposase